MKNENQKSNQTAKFNVSKFEIEYSKTLKTSAVTDSILLGLDELYLLPPANDVEMMADYVCCFVCVFSFDFLVMAPLFFSLHSPIALSHLASVSVLGFIFLI